jgi:hypothetical protein
MDCTQIDKAIAAHTKWKTRLTEAIESGKLDTPLATVASDHQCDFGRWLYGNTIDGGHKDTTHYEEVKQLHASFHQAAARVAEMATAGKATDARKLMEPSGDFTDRSVKLVRSLLAWKLAVR